MRKIRSEDPRSLDENEIYVDDVDKHIHVVAGSLYNRLVIAQPSSWGSNLYRFVMVHNLNYNLDGYGGARLNNLIKQYIEVNESKLSNKEYHNKFYAFDSWQEAFLWLVSQEPTGVKQLSYTIGDATTIICDNMVFGFGSTGSVDNDSLDHDENNFLSQEEEDKYDDWGESILWDYYKNYWMDKEEEGMDESNGSYVPPTNMVPPPQESDSQQNVDQLFDESDVEDIQEDGRKWFEMLSEEFNNIYQAPEEDLEEIHEWEEIDEDIFDILEESGAIVNEAVDNMVEYLREEEDNRILDEMLKHYEESYLCPEKEKEDPISFQAAKRAAADKVYIPKDKRDTVSIRTNVKENTGHYNLEQQEKCLANEKKQKDLERAKTELGILLDEMESLNSVEKAILELLK